jgi:hypothetical protein
MCPGRTAAKFRAAIGGSFFAKHESMVPRIKSQKQKIAFFASAAAAAQLWADMSSVRACHIPSQNESSRMRVPRIEGWFFCVFSVLCENCKLIFCFNFLHSPEM